MVRKLTSISILTNIMRTNKYLKKKIYKKSFILIMTFMGSFMSTTKTLSRGILGKKNIDQGEMILPTFAR